MSDSNGFKQFFLSFWHNFYIHKTIKDLRHVGSFESQGLVQAFGRQVIKIGVNSLIHVLKNVTDPKIS